MTHVPEQQISAWIDRQLRPDEAAEVELHLRQCESCRRFQEELASTDSLYHELEPVEIPSFLWTRVAAELDRPAEPEHFAWLPWRAWSMDRRSLLALAAVFLLVAGGTVVAVIQHQAATRSELALIAQLDDVHTKLVAMNVEAYNPFQIQTRADPDPNPFARPHTNADSNPFGPLREKR